MVSMRIGLAKNYCNERIGNADIVMHSTGAGLGRRERRSGDLSFQQRASSYIISQDGALTILPNLIGDMQSVHFCVRSPIERLSSKEARNMALGKLLNFP